MVEASRLNVFKWLLGCVDLAKYCVFSFPISSVLVYELLRVLVYSLVFYCVCLYACIYVYDCIRTSVSGLLHPSCPVVLFH